MNKHKEEEKGQGDKVKNWNTGHKGEKDKMSPQGQDSGKMMLFTNVLYKDHFYPGKGFATTMKHYSKVLENPGA